MLDFLVKLQSECDQVAENQISRFESGLSQEQFREKCDKAAENIRRLRISIGGIFNEQLFPMIESAADISEEDEADIYGFAQKLASFEKRQDPGLALKIYQALLKRAHAQKHDEKIIKYSYWCGITQFLFYAKKDKAIFECFEQGAAYADRYESFEDPEIRQYIHRCLGNVCMMLYGEDPQKAIEQEKFNFAFWNELIFRGKDPDFPWLNYFLNGYNHKYAFMTETVNADPESETRENLNEILNVAIEMNKLYSKNKEYYNVFGGTRYEYHMWEAQFLLGMISFDQLIENVQKRQAEIAPDDYSHDAMYVKIHLNSHLIYCVTKIGYLKDRKEDVVKKALKDTMDYFNSIPSTVGTEDVNMYLRMFLEEQNDIFDQDEQLELILKMTIFRNITGHVHSLMVGKVASLMTGYLIEENPACFIGCLDIAQEDEVRARTEELCRFAEMSGLCHDIGKVMRIDNPLMRIRALTNEEFDIIKEHPKEGVTMMTGGDRTALHEGYIDVIAGHHKFYDNNRGYPESTDLSQSKNKMMIDIIAVADAIVAATDIISKTYSDVKSLEAITGEIKAKAGSRYSPIVAKLLDDEAVFSSIKRLLDEERPDAYYKAYLSAGTKEGNL